MPEDGTDRQAQDGLDLGILAGADDHAASPADGAAKNGEPKDKDGKTIMDPEEQKERTRLGRTVAGLKTELSFLTDKFSRIDETLARFSETFERMTPRNDDRRDDDEPLTDDDRRRFEKYEAEKTQAQRSYEMGFRKTLDQIKDKDPATHKEIFDEMLANFNVKHSNNPGVDAQLNYANAKASMLAKKLATEKKRQERKLPPSGLSVGTRMTEEGDPAIVLSPDAEEYVKRRGLSREFIEKAMKE